MKKYKVTITETLQMEVEVKAPSREEACDKIERKWKNSEYILDAENFMGVDFTAERIKRERDYER